MEIFRFKVIAFAVLAQVANVQATVVPSAAARLANSYCFSRPYGGYLLHSTSVDGTLRLTAEVRSSGSGRMSGLELLMRPEEVQKVWEQAISSELSSVEIEALLPFCSPENTSLKSALEKETFNRTLESRPAINREIQRAMPDFPGFPAESRKELSTQEQEAVQAFRNDPVAVGGAAKLSSRVFIRVHELFLPIGQQRARHIPYVYQDHQGEFIRSFNDRTRSVKP